ncbi:MAG: PRC-barrel domain-containing protein [Panacagrimonas sp.]
MLYRMEKLIGLSISTSDGELGKIRDIYFDDRRWAVRYLVVETGSWLEERKVLISPLAVLRIDWKEGIVHVRLTQQQVKGSPPLDAHKSVSRQHELEYFNYYGYPDYLTGPLLWGLTPYPVIPSGESTPYNQGLVACANEKKDDPHLRSISEVKGYQLHATDASMGHLEDLMIDNGSWAVRYLVVDTANWWFGKHVVMPVQWIQKLDWDAKSVFVDVTRETVRHAPEYDATIQFSREYETLLFGHYERPGYWH